MTAAETKPKLTLALDAIDCSNRCRHCEVISGPHRRHLSRDEIRAWAEEMRQEALRLNIEVELGSSNTELLDHPQWREILADFGDESLHRGFPTNGRQIARDPTLIDELRARGVEWIQLTLGGASAATHDTFARRRGAFDDILRAARAVLGAGMHLVWIYIAYRPLEEVVRMSELATGISGPEIDHSIFLVKPQREGARMEHLRPSQADVEQLPGPLRERFSRSFGAGCETEGEIVDALCNSDRRVGCLEQGHPRETSSCVVVYRDGDVYPLCHERESAYLLGNLSQGGLERVLDRLRGTSAPTALAVRRRGLPELAAAYGDAESERLHSGCSLCRTLVARALKQEGFVR